jgi:hypothetical protein
MVRPLAAPPVAEREVLAADQVFRADPVAQHALEERLGRQQAERAVEPQLEHGADAERAERLRPLVRQGEAERRVVRPEQLSRVRLERQHGEARGRPRRVRRPQQVRVAAVDAVEVAERRRGAPQLRRQLREVADDPRGRAHSRARTQSLTKLASPRAWKSARSLAWS